jgi:hypothetical protein
MNENKRDELTGNYLADIEILWNDLTSRIGKEKILTVSKKDFFKAGFITGVKCAAAMREKELRGVVAC